jgi:hypothetical protein
MEPQMAQMSADGKGLSANNTLDPAACPSKPNDHQSWRRRVPRGKRALERSRPREHGDSAHESPLEMEQGMTGCATGIYGGGPPAPARTELQTSPLVLIRGSLSACGCPGPIRAHHLRATGTSPAEAGSRHGRTGPAEAGSRHGRTGPAEAGSRHGRTGPAEAGSRHGRTGPAEAGSRHGRTGPAEAGSRHGRRGPAEAGSRHCRTGPAETADQSSSGLILTSSYQTVPVALARDMRM